MSKGVHYGHLQVEVSFMAGSYEPGIVGKDCPLHSLGQDHPNCRHRELKEIMLCKWHC